MHAQNLMVAPFTIGWYASAVLLFIIIRESPTDVGVKKDFVPRVTLGTILNQQNLELL